MGEINTREMVPKSFSVNGQEYFRYDSKTGTLQLSMSPRDLRTLQDKIGDIPDEGIWLELSNPLPFLPGPLRFAYVRRVETIPSEGGDYIINLKSFNL